MGAEHANRSILTCRAKRGTESSSLTRFEVAQRGGFRAEGLVIYLAKPIGLTIQRKGTEAPKARQFVNLLCHCEQTVGPLAL